MTFQGVVISPTHPDKLVAEFGPESFLPTYSDGSLSSHQAQKFDYTRYDRELLGDRAVNFFHYLYKKNSISVSEDLALPMLAFYQKTNGMSHEKDHQETRLEAYDFVLKHQSEIASLHPSLMTDITGFVSLTEAEKQLSTGQMTLASFSKAHIPDSTSVDKFIQKMTESLMSDRKFFDGVEAFINTEIFKKPSQVDHNSDQETLKGFQAAISFTGQNKNNKNPGTQGPNQNNSNLN